MNNIHIVLVATTHPGNIGAAARAMKTMGLKQLDLVATRVFPSAEATARASGADDILGSAVMHETLADAVADSALVLATSSRTRSISWPVLTPDQAMQNALDRATAGARVAIVFGRESSGLTNAEMDLCHAMIRIPTNPDFPSLNIASAVQILSYELGKLVLNGASSPAGEGSRIPLADSAQMHRFYAHLQACMQEIGYYDPDKPRLLMRRMKRLFNRAQLDLNEYNILMGILEAARTAAKNSQGPAD
jgi:TrmH family RNA methyltransferase